MRTRESLGAPRKLAPRYNRESTVKTDRRLTSLRADSIRVIQRIAWRASRGPINNVFRGSQFYCAANVVHSRAEMRSEEGFRMRKKFRVNPLWTSLHR